MQRDASNGRRRVRKILLNVFALQLEVAWKLRIRCVYGEAQRERFQRIKLSPLFAQCLIPRENDSQLQSNMLQKCEY